VFLFIGVGSGWVHLVRRPLTGLLYQPRPIDDECRAVGGMRIVMGNRSTWRKPAPVPLCPPHIPHDLNWARTRAAAVGNRRLTAWAMARPKLCLCYLKSSWMSRHLAHRVFVCSILIIIDHFPPSILTDWSLQQYAMCLLEHRNQNCLKKECWWESISVLLSDFC
jgi:hypothetical protein